MYVIILPLLKAEMNCREAGIKLSTAVQSVATLPCETLNYTTYSIIIIISNNNGVAFSDVGHAICRPITRISVCSRLVFFINFYRATLCVSAVLAVARCLSVCPSVCHVGGLYRDG